jgi:hypothetical protein
MPATLNCPSCGDALSQGSAHCPRCGAAANVSETVEMPPIAPSPTPGEQHAVTFPATMHKLHRRPLGVAPETLLGTCATVALMAAVVLFATGQWIGGLIALVVAIGTSALFGTAIRHQPDTPTARRTRRAIVSVSTSVRLMLVKLRTWSGAGVALLHIAQRRHRLRRKLRGQLGPLGEAVYRDDRERAETLKARASQIDQALKQAEREASAVVASAREEVARERTTAEPTEALPIDQINP